MKSKVNEFLCSILLKLEKGEVAREFENSFDPIESSYLGSQEESTLA